MTKTRLTLSVLVASLALPLAGCTRILADGQAIAIAATPLPAPEPEPEPEPEPMKLVEVTEDAIVIHDKIQFDTGKATIKSESFGLLDEIAGVFKATPRIKEVSIDGHTDSVGSDKSNQKLSEDRAASVRTYLLEHGVEEGRLTSQGFGESKPIGDNETDEGKAKNRRVEFNITKQDEVKKTYEEDPKTGERREVATGGSH